MTIPPAPQAEFHRRLLEEHLRRGSEIRNRLREFREVPEQDYLYELLYCLLTPQSSARNAGAVISVLRTRNFAKSPFDAEDILRSKEHYIRFHRTKAVRLREAVGIFSQVRDKLLADEPAPDLRAWLVHTVDGLGMKEATHFLRNIGRNDGLAILDRHILRNLVRAGVIGEVPGSISERTYLAIEAAFAGFAESIGIPLDELDLLFWSMETGEVLK